MNRFQHVSECRRAVAILALCALISSCDIAKPTARTATVNVNGMAESLREKTIGLVLASYDYAFHQTADGKQECPKGLVPSNQQNWETEFPTTADRQAHLNRCGFMRNRGPNCEDVWSHPELIEDPLGYPTVEGKIAHGVNLDGNDDGSATETTCKHEPFLSPEGMPGIDNQYYRLFGCHYTLFRGEYTTDEAIRKFVLQSKVYRVLLEITDVDSEENDEHVEVAIYRGKDPLVVDAQGQVGHAVPWQTQRIDATVPPVYLRGKIVAGVLTTEPKDVVWWGIEMERRLLIRGMSLSLAISATGAEGLRVGYIDVRHLWHSYISNARYSGRLMASPPALYGAMHQLADGYKDLKSGACTALSSAQKLKFVRAYVVPADSGMTQ